MLAKTYYYLNSFKDVIKLYAELKLESIDTSNNSNRYFKRSVCEAFCLVRNLMCLFIGLIAVFIVGVSSLRVGFCLIVRFGVWQRGLILFSFGFVSL